MEVFGRRGPKYWYSTDAVRSMLGIITQFSLKGDVKPLFHAIAGFLLQRDVAWCKQMLPLPSRAQQYRYVRMAGAISQDQHQLTIAGAHCIAMTADEATIARKKQLAINVSYLNLVSALNRQTLPSLEVPIRITACDCKPPLERAASSLCMH
jgi:hypothetical protein